MTVHMTPMTSSMQESILAMMNDSHVGYAQRVRYFFHICKDRLDGRSRVALVKRLDHLLAIALLQSQEWHSQLMVLIVEAVTIGALHNEDHHFLSNQLSLCVTGRGEKTGDAKGRRIGAPRQSKP